MTENNSNQNESSTESLPLSRRTLFALGGLGILGLGSQGVSAEEDHDHWGEMWTNTEEGEDGLWVANLADEGDGRGLVGRTDARDGTALQGTAASDDGSATGLVGLSQSSSGTGVRGNANSDSGSARGVDGWSSGNSGVGVRGWARADSGETYGVIGRADSDDGYGLYSPDDVKIEGDLEVEGTKHFVQAVDTSSGPVNVAYNAVEAGKAHTEANDVAEMEDGRAVVDLPDHFGMVTSDDEPLTVQVTPYAREAVQPQVVERSTDRIVVEDFGDGPDEYSFAYTVKGVRRGFEDEPVVRDP